MTRLLFRFLCAVSKQRAGIIFFLFSVLLLTGCTRYSSEPGRQQENLQNIAEGPLSCQYFGQTAQTLALRSDQDEIIRIADLDFQVSPFVPSQLSCMKWLEGIWKQQGLEKRWKTRPTLSDEGIREGRLVGEERFNLYENCFDSPLCRVRFPYTLGWWRLRRLFDRDAFSPFSQNRDYCKNAPQKPATNPRSLEMTQVIHEQDLQELKFWNLRETSLTEQVKTLIQREREGVLFVSTMMAQRSEIENIQAALADYPLITLYLLFDIAASISNYAMHTWIQSDSEQLFLVPITPRPDRPTFFHFKGAVAWSKEGWLTFTSVNLADHSDDEIRDLGFTARGKKVADALVRVFADEFRRACTEPEYLACTLAARTSQRDPLRYAVRAALTTSCRSFFETGLSNKVASLPNPYFLTTTRDDIIHELTSFIAKAQHSVLAFTDRLDSWPFLFSLRKASERGIYAAVYVGKRGDHPVWRAKPFQAYLHATEPVEKTFGHPHAKFVLRDNQDAFWGTGNLTKNGLSDATEYFFFTDHPQIIQQLQQFAAPFLSAPAEDTRMIE